MFIEFEGVDASGKATQSRRLADILGAKHYSFPAYATPMGKLIGDYLAERIATTGQPADGHPYPVNAMVLQSLMLSNRMEFATEIAEAARTGHVVCDRYWHSAYAYAQTDGISGEYITALHARLPQSDCHIYLRVSPEAQKQRIMARGRTLDRYEKTAGLMDCVARNYLDLWSAKADEVSNPSDFWRWRVVDGDGTPDEVETRVVDAVLECSWSEWDRAEILSDRAKLVGLQRALSEASDG